jgi:hypothetical protein
MRRLMPHAPIIMLSGAVDVSEQALKWVNTFIAKDRLATPVVACHCAIAGRLIDCETVSAFYPNGGSYERKLTSLLPSAWPGSTSLTLTRRSMQKKGQ